jgi:hypothetical protein
MKIYLKNKEINFCSEYNIQEFPFLLETDQKLKVTSVFRFNNKYYIVRNIFSFQNSAVVVEVQYNLNPSQTHVHYWKCPCCGYNTKTDDDSGFKSYRATLSYGRWHCPRCNSEFANTERLESWVTIVPIKVETVIDIDI